MGPTGGMIQVEIELWRYRPVEETALGQGLMACLRHKEMNVEHDAIGLHTCWDIVEEGLGGVIQEPGIWACHISASDDRRWMRLFRIERDPILGELVIADDLFKQPTNITRWPPKK